MKEEVVIKRNFKGVLISLRVWKKVVGIGNSSHVLLPKEMIGKRVEIRYDKKNEGNR